jgi:hypothetical protein
MPHIVEARRVMQTPLWTAIEKKFVTTSQKRACHKRRYKFSLGKLLELLFEDLTLDEIAEKLKIPASTVHYSYDAYCRSIPCFGMESGMERHRRIWKKRKEQKIATLQNSTIEMPLLKEIEAMATRKGCLVRPLVRVNNVSGRIRVSPNALTIDGRSCYVHLISNSAQHSKKEDSPAVLSRLKLRSISIMDFGVRIICIRVPGFGKRTYVVPSGIIRDALFGKNPEAREAALYITLRSKHKGSRTLDIRSYLDAFDQIKYLP